MDGERARVRRTGAEGMELVARQGTWLTMSWVRGPKLAHFGFAKGSRGTVVTVRVELPGLAASEADRLPATIEACWSAWLEGAWSAIAAGGGAPRVGGAPDWDRVHKEGRWRATQGVILLVAGLGAELFVVAVTVLSSPPLVAGPGAYLLHFPLTLILGGAQYLGSGLSAMRDADLRTAKRLASLRQP